MIKADIIKTLAKKHCLTVRQASAILQTSLDEIVSGLVKDGNVELRRFGVFKTKKQKPRTIIHPQTGKPVNRSAQTIVLFETSSTVKVALNKPRQAKIKKAMDTIIEDAIKQYNDGKTIRLRKFAKKYKIKRSK
jgi:nucleoid DNA-binding protein